MSNYEAVYEEIFRRNLRRYASLRQRIKNRIDRILVDPYANTEALSDRSSKLNLVGCRSARIDRNFRVIFVICEECLQIPDCEYCFCGDLSEQTVVFLTVGPHDRAYAMES